MGMLPSQDNPFTQRAGQKVQAKQDALNVRQNPFEFARSPGTSPFGMPAPFQSEQPGLMANPSAFQFIQAMMNQPGSQFTPGNVPDYGTGFNFGVPQYLPEQLPFKGLATPPPVTQRPGGTSGTSGGNDREKGAGSER